MTDNVPSVFLIIPGQPHQEVPEMQLQTGKEHASYLTGACRHSSAHIVLCIVESLRFFNLRGLVVVSS